jgi:6-pyruvoyltetrahydropterin/6-carboxytetrahydropterin synthase
MITVFATFTFEASHWLPKVPRGHKCGRMHGHNWTVEIRATGEPNERGWLVDFYEIESAWNQIYKRVDHRTLNKIRGLEKPDDGEHRHVDLLADGRPR